MCTCSHCSLREDRLEREAQVAKTFLSIAEEGIRENERAKVLEQVELIMRSYIKMQSEREIREILNYIADEIQKLK